MPLRSSRLRTVLPALFVFALAVRLLGVNFDEGHHYHPDERRIAEAVLQLSFSPLQLNPHFFAYGSLPFYVTKVASTVLGVASPWLRGYDGVILLSRILGAVWGALTVALLGYLGSRLYGKRVGLLAGTLLGAAVLHVQNSHFGTNDVPLTALVLLALTLLVRYVEDGRALFAVLSGLAIGLAAATKISALPLLLPLSLAVLFRWRAERSPWKPLVCGALGFAAVGAGFAIGSPYALLDFRAFLHDVVEQSNMVRHAGLLPYTTQYVGVPKVLYDLGQMVLWGMGPLLGIAAILGTLRRLGAAIRRPSRAEWILLSWLVPFFAITSSFEVKFPRYLLPIYPLLILFGAKLLDDLVDRGRAGRVARAAVVAGTFAYLFAFLTISFRPFTIHTASEWVYEHIPAGSKILGQHWDEGFPFHLPGRAPELYTIVELPYYEEDNQAKVQLLAKELASADWMVLQTKRLYGAITRAPKKYPQTNAYFHLLFAGDLGYTPEKEFASRPSFLGLELPDELADESFSVYDHPKALLFKNTGRLSAPEIEKKIMNGVPSRPLTRKDLLLTRAGKPEAGGKGLLRASLPAALLCAALLQVLGLAGYALLAPLVGPRPGLYALSKVLGVLAFAYLSWLVASIGWLPFSRGVLHGVAGLVVIAALVARRRYPREAAPRKERIATELAAWGAFAFFLIARAIRPEIFWGEKPMDFSFLNALYRTTTLPPPEPWLAGSLLSYTYFGHFIVAAIGKALAIHPGVMFNLGIAATASLFASALFAAGTALGRSSRIGGLAVFLTLFCANLSGVREALARRTFNFDYFWATSRVIKDTINEYPFWSYLFADLHAHVLAMPFTVSFVALLLMWAERPGPFERTPFRQRLALLGLLALTLGTVMVTNGWSTPTYVVLALFVFLTSFLVHRERSGFLRLVLGAVWRVLLPTAVLVGGAVLLYRPFWKHFTPPERNWGIERGPYARPWDFFNIHGLFLLLVVPFFFVLFRRSLERKGASKGSRARWTGALLFLVLLTLVDLPALVKLSLHPAPSVRGFALALTALGLFLLLDRGLEERHLMPVALATFALAVTGGCELIYVWDRMNTIFKFYLEAWSLLGLASAAILAELMRANASTPGMESQQGELVKGWKRTVWRVAVAAALAVCLFTSVTGLHGVLDMKRVPGPSGTLDGTAYLSHYQPLDRAAYEWLNKNVPGIPVLVEAWGPSYQEFSRATMNTGLPIVLGWEYHVFQRGHSWPEINKRKADVETIYTSTSEADVAAALRRYHVSLIYVGTLERATYSGGNIARFKTWTDLLAPVYENAGVTIFAVNGTFAGGAPVETVERVVEEVGKAPAAEKRQDAAGRLNQPRGVARDAKGNVYVADFGNNRIQKLDAELKPLASWGRHGKLSGEFQDPCGVAIGPDGLVYVADTWNGRVQVFDADGKYVREFGRELFGPRGIAVDPSGAVFISDTGNHRVLRFGVDGKQEAIIGGKGKVEGKLTEPVGVGVDAAGRVWVCDNGNARVQVFDRDGRFLSGFPVPGWRSEVFSEPYVTFDTSGNAWLTVPKEHEVRAYTPEGKLLKTVKKSDLPPGTGYETPVGIAWSAEEKRLLVSDIENRLVWVKVE